MFNVDTLLNWIVATISIGLLATIVVGWLLSYREAKAAPVGPGKWIFALPAWAQIGGGLTITALLAYLGYALWIPLPLTMPAGALEILRIVGLALFLTGALLVLWARWTLGAMYGVSTSCAAQLKEQHRLIQHGPYALVRHPMYLGYWLLLAGVALIYRTWSPLLLLTMFVPAFYRRAQREERALEVVLGAEWQAYASRVPMFVPRWTFRHIAREKGRE